MCAVVWNALTTVSANHDMRYAVVQRGVYVYVYYAAQRWRARTHVYLLWKEMMGTAARLDHRFHFLHEGAMNSNHRGLRARPAPSHNRGGRFAVNVADGLDGWVN